MHYHYAPYPPQLYRTPIWSPPPPRRALKWGPWWTREAWVFVGVVLALVLTAIIVVITHSLYERNHPPQRDEISYQMGYDDARHDTVGLGCQVWWDTHQEFAGNPVLNPNPPKSYNDYMQGCHDAGGH